MSWKIPVERSGQECLLAALQSTNDHIMWLLSNPFLGQTEALREAHKRAEKLVDALAAIAEKKTEDTR